MEGPLGYRIKVKASPMVELSLWAESNRARVRYGSHPFGFGPVGVLSRSALDRFGFVSDRVRILYNPYGV